MRQKYRTGGLRGSGVPSALARPKGVCWCCHADLVVAVAQFYDPDVRTIRPVADRKQDVCFRFDQVCFAFGGEGT